MEIQKVNVSALMGVFQDASPMTFRAKVNVVGLSLTSILILTSTESRSAGTAAKLDAYYTAHYWDCRSGTFPGLLILKKIVLVRWQRDRSVDSCDCFWMHKDQSRRRVAYLAVSQSHPSSN